MYRNFLYLFILLSFLLGISSPSYAIIGETGEFTGDAVDIKITAENFSGQADSEEYHVWGDVIITRDDAVLEAEDVVFNSETNVAVAKGDVYFYQPGTQLWGDILTVEYDDKRGIWQGYVVLIQTEPPKKSGEQASDVFKEGPVKMISDELEFFWSKPSKVVARGLVEAHQNDKHVYADKGTYISPPDTITMEGNVLLERDDGTWLKCDTIVMHVKTDKFQADGTKDSQVQANIFYEKNKVE